MLKSDRILAQPHHPVFAEVATKLGRTEVETRSRWLRLRTLLEALDAWSPYVSLSDRIRKYPAEDIHTELFTLMSRSRAYIRYLDDYCAALKLAKDENKGSDPRWATWVPVIARPHLIDFGDDEQVPVADEAGFIRLRKNKDILLSRIRHNIANLVKASQPPASQNGAKEGPEQRSITGHSESTNRHHASAPRKEDKFRAVQPDPDSDSDTPLASRNFTSPRIPTNVTSSSSRIPTDVARTRQPSDTLLTNPSNSQNAAPQASTTKQVQNLLPVGRTQFVLSTYPETWSSGHLAQFLCIAGPFFHADTDE